MRLLSRHGYNTHTHTNRQKKKKKKRSIWGLLLSFLQLRSGPIGCAQLRSGLTERSWSRTSCMSVFPARCHDVIFVNNQLLDSHDWDESLTQGRRRSLGPTLSAVTLVFRFSLQWAVVCNIEELFFFCSGLTFLYLSFLMYICFLRKIIKWKI